MSSFKNTRMVDNFYQTSSFFPMPTILIGTLDEKGNTSCGAYSLCFPYYIAGKNSYAMILECRNSSNTCKGILRTGKCSLNFLPDCKKFFKEIVRLGFPGDSPEEKMKDCIFHLEEGHRHIENSKESYPKVIKEAFQVMECTWIKTLDNAQYDKIQEEYEGPYHNFNEITSKYGAHFILRIDKILLKEKYYNAILHGITKNNFPKVPVDYGYRDSTNFWCSKFKKPFAQPIPNKEVDLESVKYAANRVDDTIKFSDEACKMMVKVPRIFLSIVLKGCIAWAKENNCTYITEKEMQIIQEKRKEEKNKKKK